MTIALSTNWGHSFAAGASACPSPSASPANATDWICGWFSTNEPLTSITDSVNGVIPPAQIVSFGADAGAQAISTYLFYELAGGTAARTITGNLGAAGASSIAVFSFAGLAASNILDVAVTPGNTGTGTAPLTSTSPATRSANQVVLFYWMLDHFAAATAWSGPAVINGFTGGTFAGLGNLANNTVPQFDAGFYILSSGGQSGSASINSSISDAWMGCIATFSATPIAGPPPALLGQSGFMSPW